MNIFPYITSDGRTPLTRHRDLRQSQRADSRPAPTIHICGRTQGPPLPIMFVMILMLLIWANSSFASVDFVSSEIDTGDNRQGYWTSDMNGDNLQDILIATWSEANGREFLIYTQEKSGKFSGSPWRRIEIKKDIIAFAIADLRPDPGSELLFFTGSACYSLSCAREGYANNLKKLFDWELIKSVPDKKKIDYIGELKDMNNDGFVDILLPGQKQYGFFTGQPDEVFSKQSILPAGDEIINKSRRTQRSVTLDPSGLSVGGPDIYSGLLVHRLEPGSVSRIFQPSILKYEHWIPGVSTARFNSDELEDFVYLDDMETSEKNTRRLNILYQPQTGEFPSAPHWQANITINDRLKMIDVNGDRLTDLVTTKWHRSNNTGANINTLFIYLNQEGRFNFNTPSYVMKINGMNFEFDSIDYNQDGFPELVINTYSVGLINAITSGRVTRKLLIFAGRKTSEGAPLFDRRPSGTYEETFTADEFTSLIVNRSFSGDVDGDGNKDLISVDNDGALTANRINNDLQIESEPFLRFVPMHFITDSRLAKLNQDHQTDIIIEHQHALTLLISQGVRQ